MLYFFIGLMVIIGVTIWAVIAEQKKQKEKTEKANKYFEHEGFKVNKRIGSFCTDTINKKWAIIQEQENKHPIIYNFTDIIDFELVENGNKYKSQNGILRSVVGGATFGLAGAVVGASTAKKSTSINNMSVNIHINNIDEPLVIIN